MGKVATVKDADGDTVRSPIEKQEQRAVEQEGPSESAKTQQPDDKMGTDKIETKLSELRRDHLIGRTKGDFPMFERIAFYTTITVIGEMIGYLTALTSAEIAFILSAMIARNI